LVRRSLVISLKPRADLRRWEVRALAHDIVARHRSLLVAGIADLLERELRPAERIERDLERLEGL
jgi:hypothetical protein